MKPLEHYCDYRQYLMDYYEERKKAHSFFSYRYFARKAGLKSSSLIQEVMAGKRNLTEITLTGVLQGLGLKGRQADFFRALCNFNQAKTAPEKNKQLEIMRQLLPRLDEKTVPANFYAYYAHWYNIAIRELACAFNWHEDYGLLASRLKPAITKTQARESVKLLLELGFLVKDKEGIYNQTDLRISAGPEVMSHSIRNVNQQFSEIGTAAIEAIAPDRRDISSLVIGVSRENYPLLKSEIQAFKDRVKRIIADQKVMDTVYNLNVQLFPISEEVKP